ncbi:hypothetical protein ACFL2T_03340 [Elusimicrobiota bacterium]
MNFPFPSRRRIVLAFLAIGVVELVSFGICVRELGFYHDDWVWLEILRLHPGYWAGWRAMLEAGWGVRPVAALPFPAIFACAGSNPLPYHALLLLVNVAAGFLCYLWLARLTGSHGLALLASCLWISYPVHPATHYWFTNIHQPAAQAMCFGSFLLHLSWLRTRQRRWAVAASLLYLAAFLCYEAVAFLPLAAWFGLLARLWASGKPLPSAALQSGRFLLPYAPAFAAGFAWQWVGVSLFYPSNPKHMAFSLKWPLVVYASGLESITLSAARLIRNTLFELLETFDDAKLLLLGLFTAVVTGLLRLREREDKRGAAAPLIALAVAGGNYLAAYAPFALSGEYEPQVVGVMSRTNYSGALSGALLLAAGLATLSRHEPALLAKAGIRRVIPLHAIVLASILAAFTWTNWFVALRWAGAWRQQRDILERIVPKAPLLPRNASLILLNAPTHHYGTEVFYEDWGFAAALTLKTGRRDLSGIVFTRWMRPEAQGVVERRGGRTRVLPYDGLYQYDAATDRLTKVVR